MDGGTYLPLMSRPVSRFETPWPFLRTHPYFAKRHEDLARYLAAIGRRASSPQVRREQADALEQRR